MFRQGIAGAVSYLVLRFVFGLDWWISFPVALLVAAGVYWLMVARKN